MSHAYKFAHHQYVRPEPPTGYSADIAETAWSDKPLTRAQKDALAYLCHGTFGCGGGTYREGGWAWPLYTAPRMRRILVRARHDNVFHIYYAPDKTGLRKALGRSAAAEMVYA